MNRIASIDTVRLLALMSIIIIHTAPFQEGYGGGEVYKCISIIIDQISRFAVPFFFVISGYFWGEKINYSNLITPVTKKSLKRVSIIFVAWSFIYIFPYNITSIMEYGILSSVKVAAWNFLNLLAHPLDLIFQGTKDHLWFLVALANAIIVSYFFIKNKLEKELIIISFILYIFGVLSKSYSNTPIGMCIDFNTRNGPFFGTIFFVTGYFFSKRENAKSWFLHGALLLIFGILMHFSEIYMLWKYFKISPYQDYVVGTYFMGVGASMIALSNHSALSIGFLSRTGQYGLGIYAIQYIFVDIFRNEKMYFNPVWEIVYVLLVSFFSITIVYLASKNKLLKKIVL